jgi:hypothetical protein
MDFRILRGSSAGALLAILRPQDLTGNGPQAFQARL